MQPVPPPYQRRARFGLFAVVLVILLALVAFSSRSGFGGSSSPAPSNSYVSYAMSVFLILFVIMIPIAIYSYVIRTREMGPSGRAPSKRFYRMILSLVILGVALYVVHYAKTRGLGIFGRDGLFNQGAKLPHTNKHGVHGPLASSSPHFEYSVLWVAIAIGVLCVIAWLVVRARRKPLEVHETPTFEEELVSTIDDAIDDLERVSDPRRAVIAAYARMERVLGRNGLERRRSETAVEYLRRVLHELTSSGGAVEQLTSLFERAKFSHHEVTDAMKQDAIASLRDIRDGVMA